MHPYPDDLGPEGPPEPDPTDPLLVLSDEEIRADFDNDARWTRRFR